METVITESGLQSSALFASDLNKIKSLHAVIASCQLRMLPEIRNALGDQNIGLNLTGVWNYLLKGLQSGYDSIEFLASIKSLEKLADDWKIPKEARKPLLLANRPQGILFEQGFKRPPCVGEGQQTTKTQASNGGYNQIIVNGNSLGFTSILDAVQFLNSILPNLLKSPNSDIAEEAREYLKEKNQHRMQQASVEFDKGHYQAARRILDNILLDDVQNIEANDLLEKILLAQNDKDDQDELSQLYSMRFSRSTNIHDLYKLLDIYEATGQLALAEALVEGVVHNNPSVINDKKISRFLLSEKVN